MLCSRCKKRQAVVFVTNNNSKDAPTTGYCLTCAKELGIKPVEDLIKKMVKTVDKSKVSSAKLTQKVFKDKKGRSCC